MTRYHVSKPVVDRTLWRGIKIGLAIEFVVGTLAVLLFIFGLPWLGGALAAAFGIAP